MKWLAYYDRFHKEMFKFEMNQDEVDGDKYKGKNDEWLDYVKQDTLCTGFSYAR